MGSVSRGNLNDQRAFQTSFTNGGVRGSTDYLEQQLKKESQTPPPPPDLTDAAVRAAAIEGYGAMGKGRKSTFLGGPGGFAAPTTQRKTLLGG